MNSPVIKYLSKILDNEYILETSSGTAALIASLKLGDFEEGKEVIIPSVVCPAVLSSVNLSGLKPVFADMEIKHFNMDIQNVTKLINENTVCIIGVHCFGITSEILALENICKKNNIMLIEDCCLSFGNSFENRRIGTFGDTSVFSFGYDKLITGAGGALALKSKEDFLKASKFLHENKFFQPTTYSHKNIENQFKNLDSNLNTRRNNAVKFSNLLDENKVIKPAFREFDTYWRYPCLVLDDRLTLMKLGLDNKTIITSHYPALSKFQFNSNLEIAELFDSKIINLFVNESATDNYIEKVVELINNG